jgi:DNA helicase-2/ATP-dependent DNA helicase PcrA
VLPIDQLVLTLAQDLFGDPADLALAHKLALVLKRVGTLNVDWRLPELTDELAVVAKNQRRFLGFSEEDTGFNPDAHKGVVVVTTMHKAKGLEWDRVYLTSVNNYDFPSAQEFDRYISEKWFIRDQLDLQAETLAEFEQIFSDDPFGWPETGAASAEARIEYAAERLRLIYVGITRARKELVLTFNTGRKGDLQQAVPFAALESLWEQMS